MNYFDDTDCIIINNFNDIMTNNPFDSRFPNNEVYLLSNIGDKVIFKPNGELILNDVKS